MSEELSQALRLPSATLAEISRRRFTGLCAGAYTARVLATIGVGAGWFGSQSPARAIGPLAAFAVAQAALSAVSAFSSHGDGGIGAMFNALNEKLDVIERHLDQISVQVAELSSQLRRTEDEIIQAIAWNNFAEIAASLTGCAQEYTRLLRADSGNSHYTKTVTGRRMLESLLQQSKALSGKLQNLPEVGLSPSAAFLAPLACGLEVALVRRLAEVNGDGRACEGYVRATLENYVRWMDRFLAPDADAERKFGSKEVPIAPAGVPDGSPPSVEAGALNSGSLYERIRRTGERHDAILDDLLKLPIGAGLHLDNFKLGGSQEVVEGVTSCLIWAQGTSPEISTGVDAGGGAKAVAVAPTTELPDHSYQVTGVVADALTAWTQLRAVHPYSVPTSPQGLSLCATIVRGKIETDFDPKLNFHSLNYRPISRSAVLRKPDGTDEGETANYTATGSLGPAQPSPVDLPKSKARYFGENNGPIAELKNATPIMDAPRIKNILDWEQKKFDVGLAQVKSVRALLAYLVKAVTVAQSARRMMQEEMKLQEEMK